MLFQNSQIRRKLLLENCTPFSALRRAKTTTASRGFGLSYAHVAARKHRPRVAGRPEPGQDGFSTVFQGLFQTLFYGVLEHTFSQSF